jgi:hypothetical protein
VAEIARTVVLKALIISQVLDTIVPSGLNQEAAKSYGISRRSYRDLFFFVKDLDIFFTNHDSAKKFIARNKVRNSVDIAISKMFLIAECLS